MSEANKNYDKPFPTRLRALLEETGISQQELADFVGVKRQTIAQWKDAKTVPDIYYLQKISAYFGLPYEYLLGESDSRVRENVILSNDLGLSDKALKKLMRWAQEGKNSNDIRRSEIVSDILSHDGFDAIVGSIYKQAKEYILYRNTDAGDMPQYHLPGWDPDSGYAIEPNSLELGKATATPKDLADFYQYQSTQLFEHIISCIVEVYYVEEYLATHE